MSATTPTELAMPATQAVAPVLQGSDLLGMVVSTIVVVAAIVLLGWVYSRSKFMKSGRSDIIDIVAMRALGPKERLLIVDVADQQILIGITASAVQTLHVFETPAVITTGGEKSRTNSDGFADKLRSLMPDTKR